jgi:hypothetical protein
MQGPGFIPSAGKKYCIIMNLKKNSLVSLFLMLLTDVLFAFFVSTGVISIEVFALGWSKLELM